MTSPSDTGPAQPKPRRIHPARMGLWALSCVGLILPWIFNLQYLLAGGSLLPMAFWHSATPTPLTTAITIDVYLAALTFSLWVLTERRVRRPGVFVLLCFGVGLAFAFPLYLLYRRAPQTVGLSPEASPADAAAGPGPSAH